MKNGFCSYCECLDEEGNKRTDLSHAQTISGTWVCDACYYWDLCLISKNDPNPNGPCRDKCKHRPVLMTAWEIF